jgi:hypothetical protein
MCRGRMRSMDGRGARGTACVPAFCCHPHDDVTRRVAVGGNRDRHAASPTVTMPALPSPSRTVPRIGAQMSGEDCSSTLPSSVSMWAPRTCGPASSMESEAGLVSPSGPSGSSGLRRRWRDGGWRNGPPRRSRGGLTASPLHQVMMCVPTTRDGPAPRLWVAGSFADHGTAPGRLRLLGLPARAAARQSRRDEIPDRSNN